MRICGKNFDTTKNKKIAKLELRQGSMPDKEFKKVLAQNEAYKKECDELWDYYDNCDWFVEL